MYVDQSICIVHACTYITVHACTTIQLHACTTIKARTCTMSRVHVCSMVKVHARTMIRVHACAMIIVHACAVIIHNVRQHLGMIWTACGHHLDIMWTPFDEMQRQNIKCDCQEAWARTIVHCSDAKHNVFQKRRESSQRLVWSAASRGFSQQRCWGNCSPSKPQEIQAKVVL